MKKHTLCLIMVISLFSLRLSAQSNSLLGTWQLVSQTSTLANGRMMHLDSSRLIQVKMFTLSHFMIMAQGMIGGEKRFLFCSGGRYTLQGNELTEHNEYASYKGYELVKTTYSFIIKADTMYQKGTVIHQDGSKTGFDEVYVRDK